MIQFRIAFIRSNEFHPFFTLAPHLPQDNARTDFWDSTCRAAYTGLFPPPLRGRAREGGVRGHRLAADCQENFHTEGKRKPTPRVDIWGERHPPPCPSPARGEGTLKQRIDASEPSSRPLALVPGLVDQGALLDPRHHFSQLRPNLLDRVLRELGARRLE